MMFNGDVNNCHDWNEGINLRIYLEKEAQFPGFTFLKMREICKRSFEVWRFLKKPLVFWGLFGGSISLQYLKLNRLIYVIYFI